MKEILKCARCGRRLKRPFFIGKKPYGKSCYKKVLIKIKREMDQEGYEIFFEETREVV